MDRVPKEIRSKNMSSVRSKKTKLEDRVTKVLWQRGMRFRRNVADLPGKPDIAIKKYQIVIFIDSCFWHGCLEHSNIPNTNTEFWSKKLKRNTERDIEITQFYVERNWNILRVWEHDLKEDFNKTINSIIRFSHAVIEKINTRLVVVE